MKLRATIEFRKLFANLPEAVQEQTWLVHIQNTTGCSNSCSSIVAIASLIIHQVRSHFFCLLTVFVKVRSRQIQEMLF